MTETDHWTLIAEERRALADLIETLTDEQLASPSLCAGWSVKDVAAHVMIGPTGTMGEFLSAWVRGLGSFARANRIMTQRRRSLSRSEVVALLRGHADSRFTPPTLDWHAPLSDVLVHREDIVVSLGLPGDRPAQPWHDALDFLTSAKARRGFVSRPLPALTLAATDLDWSHGSGPVVSGPAAALGLAVCGRTEGLDRLDGPGAEPLAAWVRG